MVTNEDLNYDAEYNFAINVSTGFFGPKGQRSIAQGIALGRLARFGYAVKGQRSERDRVRDAEYGVSANIPMEVHLQ